MNNAVPHRPNGVHVKLQRTRNGKDCYGDPVWKYEVPKYLTLDAELVDAMRRGAIARRDDYVAMQKAFGSTRDISGAKWAKDEASDALKEYRSACLVLGTLVCEPPGDALFRPEWDWPTELAPWIDRVVRHCEKMRAA